MPAPELIVTRGDRGAVRTPPDDVAGLYIVTMAERGPVGAATEARSLSNWKKLHGNLIAQQPTALAVEAYFAEGGTRVVTSRVTGPAASVADHTVAGDGGALVEIEALSPGEWANSIKWTVTEDGSDRRVVGMLGEEKFFDFAATSQADLLAALNSTDYVSATAGVGTWPATVSAETAMSGGASDLVGVGLDDWAAGLAVFDRDIGPGSLAAPGVTDPDVHALLFDHAYRNNYFALADGPDTPDVVELEGRGLDIRDEMPSAGYGQAYAPWEVIPGPGLGTVKAPPSGGQAGRFARGDRTNPEGPGQYAGARFGQSRFAVDVTQEYSKAERDRLSDAGITVIRNIKGAVQAYDDVTLVDPDEWPQYIGAAGMRVAMAIDSEADEALEQRVIQLIDAKGHLMAEAEKDIVGILSRWYGRNALYGDTPDAAFKVTVTSPAPRTLEAEILIRTSENARLIRLHIVKVAVGDSI